MNAVKNTRGKVARQPGQALARLIDLNARHEREMIAAVHRWEKSRKQLQRLEKRLDAALLANDAQGVKNLLDEDFGDEP